MSKSITHMRSHALVGGYSRLCQAGVPVQVETPSECLVPLLDGVDSVCLDSNRVDLCADCLVARRASINNALPGLSEGDIPVHSNDFEAAQGGFAMGADRVHGGSFQ